MPFIEQSFKIIILVALSFYPSLITLFLILLISFSPYFSPTDTTLPPTISSNTLFSPYHTFSTTNQWLLNKSLFVYKILDY